MNLSGFGTASRLASEARGFEQAAKNAADAQTMLTTLEGGYGEMKSVLQRLRELSVQAGSDTHAIADLANIKAEYDALVEQIDEIALQTKWGGNAQLSEGGTFSYQIGDAGNETLTFTIEKISASDLSLRDSSSANLRSTTAFSAHIDLLDTAIATVVERQAQLGATINRLDNRMAFLASGSAAARDSLGRVQDADFALESVDLAKNQVLHQSAIAMLAQANASKDTVLSLLSG